ncbi:MAG TPA: MCP four helix bundle domain-containing protein, partial [Aquabacterium sp.]|nr:MCP four helix bundle domain-containing protein [Aquabacterium sp.]
MSIRVRLTALVTALLVMVVVAAAWSVALFRQSNAVLGTVYNDRVVPLQQIKLVGDAYRIQIIDAVQRVHDGVLPPAQALTLLSSAQTQIRTQWAAYEATYLVPREKELVAQAVPVMRRADEAIEQLRRLLQSGQT